MTEIRGCRILIVGATGVLGSLMARRLADAGADLVMTGRDSDRLARLGALGTTLTCDLTDPGAAERIVAEASEELGGLDGVVVAAGVVGFDDGDAPDLDRLFAVNAIGPMRVVNAALPALRASGAEGREPFVVTLSGIVSEMPTAGLSTYSASKSALAAFMSASARGLRRTGIRLIDARPGHTETGLATRPLFGTAPAFPAGHSPAAVADRIVAAIAEGETDLPSTAFAT